jgi:hypothetical protein
MQILSSINIDLQRPRAPIIVHAKQGDKFTRGVVVKLYNNGTAWTIPTEVTDVFVAFCKSDGKGGTYNKLPDNTTPACTKTGNTITAKFAPQVLTCAGLVRVDLKMVNAAEDVLKTFGFYVQVEEDAESGITSEDYWKNATLAGLQAKIGDLENLHTSEKGSVVGAINEVIPDLFFCPTFKVWTGIGIEETIDGYEWYPHQNPHVGAIVVGGNGYTAVVTRTGDHTLTKSLGTQIFVPLMSARDVTYNGKIGDYEPKNVSAAFEAVLNTIDAIPVPSARKADLDDVLAVSAVDAAGAPTAWQYRNMPYNLFFAPEVDIPAKPYSAGDATTEINLDGYALLPENNVRVGETVVGKNGYMAEVSALDEDGSPIVHSTGDRLIDLSSNDATSDYAESGAQSVKAWATMAKTGSTTQYRVAAGEYRVTDAGDVYTVRIVDSTYTSWSVRRVSIAVGDDEANAYVDVYTCNAPGTQIHHVLGVGSDDSAIVIGGKRYPLATSPETEGNILTAVKTAAGIVVPQWAAKPAYKADEIKATVTYGDETAKNVQYALDMLAANLAKVNVPAVTAADNGAFMCVVNGKWAAAQLTDVSEVGA